jgi:hypothetical protein
MASGSQIGSRSQIGLRRTLDGVRKFFTARRPGRPSRGQVRHAAASRDQPQVVVCSWQPGGSTTWSASARAQGPLNGVGNLDERWIIHDRGHEIGWPVPVASSGGCVSHPPVDTCRTLKPAVLVRLRMVHRSPFFTQSVAVVWSLRSLLRVMIRSPTLARLPSASSTCRPGVAPARRWFRARWLRLRTSSRVGASMMASKPRLRSFCQASKRPRPGR